MARFTDIVYRELCKERGADVLVSEFVRAASVLRETPEAWEGLDFTERQRPFGVQIFGAQPEEMAGAAELIVKRLRPDFIDMNFGCPADKVVCKQAGSSLLLDLPRLQAVGEAVVKAVPGTPVTGKIRIGWDETQIVAREAGERLQSAGVQAVAIHGRTKEQGYRGEADWNVIAEVAKALTIPVIGNGNVRNAEDVRRAREQYGVRGVMIGRAALGYPWIFRDIKHYLQHGEVLPPPTLRERWELLIAFAEHTMARPFRAERHVDIQWMRPKLLKLTKEMPGCKALRRSLGTVCTIAELREAAEGHIARYGETIRGHETWSEAGVLAG